MRGIASAAAFLVLVVADASAQLAAPTTWRWATDSPANHSTSLEPAPDAWLFGNMPPGWHITTRPGVVLFEPTLTVGGRYSVETEVFLFPGTSAAGFGPLAAGRSLDTKTPSYVACLIRRDGSVTIERRTDGRTESLSPWTRAEAVKPHAGGDEPQRNVVRLDVSTSAVHCSVNGTRVATAPLDPPVPEGGAGLRVGEQLNLHVATFDVTRRLAPAKDP